MSINQGLRVPFNAPNAAITIGIDVNFPGVAMGPIHRLNNGPLGSLGSTPQNTSPDKHFIEAQIQNLEAVRQATREHLAQCLEGMQSDMAVEMEGSADASFVVQMMVPEDPEIFEEDIPKKIKQGFTAAQALEIVFKEAIEKYRENEFMSKNVPDIKQVFLIMQHLLRRGKVPDSLGTVPQGAIVLADSVSLPETLQFVDKTTGNKRFHGAVGTDMSIKGHAPIIAKSMNVPFANAKDAEALKNVENGTICIIDGRKGEMYIGPNEAMKKLYADMITKDEALNKKLQQKWFKPKSVKTLDGKDITFFANLGSSYEIPMLKAVNAKRIGLYRSEIALEMFGESRERADDPEYWYKIAKTIMQDSAPEGEAYMPMTFRLLDATGDKVKMSLELVEKTHKVQIEAVLRLRDEGFEKLQLELPMVTGVKDYRTKQGWVDNIARVKGYKSYNLGIMAETPESIYEIEAIDPPFAAIGMNDLTQYTTGVPRYAASGVSGYDYTSRTIARDVKTLVDYEQVTERTRGKKKRMAVSICGDMASDADSVAYLIGLGITQFSSAIGMTPRQMEIASRVDSREAAELAKEMLKHADPDERQRIKAWFNETRLQLHPDGTFEEKFARPSNPLNFEDMTSWSAKASAAPTADNLS